MLFSFVLISIKFYIVFITYEIRTYKEVDIIAQFKPFQMDGIPIESEYMNWEEVIQEPYDKMNVDPYTRTRVILMNGIENNSVLTSHAVERMTNNPEIKKQMAEIRRVDSQQQQTVDWLNPPDQTILETTIGYEQVAVDLTANLAKNEHDSYVKSTLDFALLEDFDHLFRYGCLMQILNGEDPEQITGGKTEVKPGRPTSMEHRHPDDSMRKHYDKDEAELKTKMNYITITSGEQQTELFYKSHGNMCSDDLARKLYSEIAEIEEQHVTQYGLLGDPNETMLEKVAMIQLNEAYNYHSAAMTEPNRRIKRLWEHFAQMEITHFNMCADLIKKHEGRDIEDIMQADSIKPLIVFEPNKKYVNKVLEEQIDLMPYNMEFVHLADLPDNWPSFRYERIVNSSRVPSEDVVKGLDGGLAEKENAEIYQNFKRQMSERIQRSMAK
jgi:rubrerythrin